MSEKGEDKYTTEQKINKNKKRKNVKCYICQMDHYAINCLFRKCYNCGCFGHIKKNCPNIVCRFCKKKGHIQTFCKLKKFKKKKKKPQIIK